MLGISLFGWVHTLASLVALIAGFRLLPSLLKGGGPEGPATLFFAAASFTALSGFLFPGFGIAHRIGVLVTATLIIALLARYVFGRKGLWGRIYAASSVLSVYWLMFFTISEAFSRLPFLSPLAPTLSEPPFQIAQLLNLVVFVGLATLAAIRSGRPSPAG